MSRTHTALLKHEGPILFTDEPRREITGVTGPAPARLDFTAYLGIFWRRSKLLLCLTLLGALAGLAIGLIQTPYYRAHASLELDGVNDMYLSIREVTAEENTSLTDAYMETQAMVLGGDTMIRRALKKTPLEVQGAPRSFIALTLNTLKAKLGLRKSAPAPSGEGELEAIRQHLITRSVPLTRVIEVTYDGTDGTVAAHFTNALINEYIEASMERRVIATQQTEKWLMAYLSPLKQSLEESGRTLESYAHVSGLTGTDDNTTPAEAKLKDLQGELTRAHAERVSKQAVYETVVNGPRENIPAGINPSPLREYQTKLSDLRSEYAQAVATLTPAHFRVQRLEAQIHEMEHLIDEQWSKTLELIRSDYLASLRREALLTDSAKTQVTLAADQAGKRVHYDVLHRELETNQQIYDNILQKAKESAVLGVTRPSNAHVINEAHPASKPFKPNVPLQASLGSLSGFFLGIVWIAYREFRENHLIAPGVLPGVAQIRELGVIPLTALNEGPDKSWGLLGSRKQEAMRPMPPAESSFVFSESFQATVASIMRSRSNGTRLRVLTITSAMAGDGKTTVVTNLGLALASIRHRVVLIEGDLRHPQLSKAFGTANTWGLSDILQSSNRIEDMPFEALVKPTDKPGLFVVPSGPPSANVSGLLHSPRLSALVGALNKHADLILIDSPPLLAVSDARVLASSSDAVILVVRAHKTARETFCVAAQQLIDDQTPILGAILNAWDPRRAPGTRDPFQYQYSYGK